MNKLILSALLTVASVSSFAQEATPFDTDVAGTRSLAAVQAEVAVALAAGEQLGWGVARVVATPGAASTLTRAQVRAELRSALARGDAVRYGEARS